MNFVSCYFNWFISFHSIGLLIQKIKIKIILTFKPYALILIGMNNTLNNVPFDTKKPTF